MKRKQILLLVLTVLMVMVLSACGEPLDKYDQIYSKYSKEEYLTTKFENKLAIKNGDEEITTTSTGTMESLYDDVYTTRVSGSVASSLDENETVDFEKWFANDKYFLDVNGGKYYSEISYEEALDDLGVYGLIGGITGEGFDAIIENPSDDGGTKLDYIVKKHSPEVYGLDSILSKVASRYEGEYSISNIAGHIVFDGKLPVSQKYTVNAEITTGDATYQVTYEVNTTFDFDTEVKLEAPSVDGYTKIN